jgi:hypothetical protein
LLLLLLLLFGFHTDKICTPDPSLTQVFSSHYVKQQQQLLLLLLLHVHELRNLPQHHIHLL